MISEKKKARKKWQLTRNVEHKTEYNKLKNKVHRAELNNMLDKLDKDIEDANNSSNIWKITRRLTKPCCRIRAQPLRGTHGLAYSDIEKATELAKYLNTQFTPAPQEENLKSHYKDVHKVVTEFTTKPTEHPIRHTTPTEIMSTLKRLSCRKSPGKDGITTLALRNLPRKAITFMTKLFNVSLQFNYFPNVWKHATIITIPKGHKNPQFPHNRRPISLLSTISKLFERIILRRIQDLNFNTIPDYQMAFRSGCTTTHQILRLVETITEGFNKCAFMPAIFLDVSKAFDSVWHTGLLYKMIKNGFPVSIIKLIASYLNGRVYQVKEGRGFSSVYPINAGVAQGSVLAPVLYSIYTADIPTTTDTSIGQYADDTVLYTCHVNPLQAVLRLQKHIDEVEKWCKEWRISLNVEKTQAVCFTKCALKRVPLLSLSNTQLTYKSTVKYLGVTLDQKLLWHKHIQQTKGKAIGRITQLFPLLKSGALSIKKKLQIYKSLVLPIITYAAPAFAYSAETTLRPLQVAQNKALKIIHSSDWYTRILQIHEDLEMEYVNVIIDRIVRQFYKRAQQSSNPLVRQLCTITGKEMTNKYRTPKSVFKTVLIQD